MARRRGDILESIAAALNALPGVFSTVQWGGRAYKLPGAGTLKKPRLLAHVWLAKDGKSVGVELKLERSRAADVIERHDWIRPHSFKTLAPSGWISARVSSVRQVVVLRKLLAESHAALRPREVMSPSENRKKTTRSPHSAEAGHDAVARVLAEKREAGWLPDSDYRRDT